MKAESATDAQFTRMTARPPQVDVPPDSRCPIRQRDMFGWVHEYGGYFRNPRTLAMLHESEIAYRLATT